MKKKILLLALLSVLITGCGQVPKTKNNEDVLVELKDGTKYSVDEIWDEFKVNYALDLILNKIDNKLLDSVYEKNKKDTDEYLKSVETYFNSNYETEEDKNNALNRAGFATMDKYLENQKLGYLRDVATNEYAKTLITDKDIEKYYKENTVGDIEAVHILVKPDGTDNESLNKAKESAESIIKTIKEDIKKGTSAKEAFKKYEKVETVTYQELGRFNKGDMVQAFETAAYNLKKGEYTKTPVKTNYGYHIILKTNEYEKAELKDVKDSIKETLASKKVNEDSNLQAKALNDLRKKSKIKFHDDDLEKAYNNYMTYILNQK